MKNAALLFFAVLLVACAMENSQQKRFVGTYVRVLETTFNTLYDTIHIKPAGGDSPLLYSVTSSGRVVDKNEPPVSDRKTGKQRTGTFDKEKNALIIDDVPFVLNDKDELTNNQITYSRCATCR